MKSYEVTAAAALAAVSAALQIVHVGIITPWSIWIDLVAVSWMVAYFLYGGRTALAVSAVGALIIAMIAPTTWLGAVMKWLATIPMILVPMVMQKAMKLKIPDFKKVGTLAVAVAVALVVRCAIITPVNYYFAIPLWTGWTVAEAMSYVPWWVIVGLNCVQGILEVAIAWLLVFRFRLDRVSVWS